MRSSGKVGQAWAKYRAAWKKNHPPNHQGYYTCGICGRWVHEDEMELDHIIPRSARPDLRFEDDNLQPTHHLCNSRKGSAH